MTHKKHVPTFVQGVSVKTNPPKGERGHIPTLAEKKSRKPAAPGSAPGSGYTKGPR